MEVRQGQIIEQYVHNVRDFSASFGSKMSANFNPHTLIGPPQCLFQIPYSVQPTYAGLRSCCLPWWIEALTSPEEFATQNDKIQSHDFVEVSFKKAVYPQQVFVFETYRPGTMVRIWALGPISWVLLWEGKPKIADDVIYVSPPIKQVNFPTQILRLEFNHKLLPFYTDLDAILLKGQLPITLVNALKPEIEIPDELFAETPPLIEPGTLLASNLDGMCEELSTLESAHMNIDEGPLKSFCVLPDEVLLKVFKYVDMPTLCRCAQVNKQFYRVASDATLHKRMNFRPYWHSLRSEALLSLATKCRLLQKLDISWCGSHTMIQPNDFVFFIEHSGANLTYLRMNNCRFVDDSVLEAIVRYAPNLEELSLRSVTDCTKWSVLEGLENLKILDLYGTNIRTQAATAIIMSNPELQHLNLGCCRNINDMDEVTHALASSCPQIASLDLLNTSLAQSGYISLQRCKNLRKLTMDMCLQAGGSGEWLPALSGGELRKLFLGALRSVYDRDLRVLLPRVGP